MFNEEVKVGVGEITKSMGGREIELNCIEEDKLERNWGIGDRIVIIGGPRCIHWLGKRRIRSRVKQIWGRGGYTTDLAKRPE